MNKISRLCSVLAVGIFMCTMSFTKVHASSDIEVDRYYGGDRYETASNVAEDGWKTSSDYAVIVSGENFPDALCAGPLAKKYDAPILLVKKNDITPYTSMELSRLNVKNVFLVGGTGVISQSLEDSIKSRKIKVTRISGDTRYDTSIAVAKKIGSTKQIAVVSGESFYDGVTMSSIAAFKGMPLVLVPSKGMPKNTENFLKSNKKDDAVYVIGTKKQVGDNVTDIIPNVIRIANDSDIFSRNVDIISQFKNEISTSTIYVATSKNFADSLAASALAAQTGSPVILVGDYISSSTNAFLSSSIVANVKILGGGGAISYTQEDEIKRIPLSVSDNNYNLFTDTIWQDDTYIPRTTVVVNTSSGEEKDVNVTWNITRVNTSNPGTYTLHGKIAGTDSDATATLIIKPIPTKIDDIERETSRNSHFNFPRTVEAEMSDGRTKTVDVTWEYEQQNIKTAGVYTFYGNVERYKKKVKLTLTVI